MTTPRSDQFDDIYFSPEDGLAETRHVFLAQNGLPEGWQDRSLFHIAELGFGTGLNFLAAASLFQQTANPDQHLVFSSIEKYPLDAATIRAALEPWAPAFGGLLEQMCRLLPIRVTGSHPIRITPQITLILHYGDVAQALPQITLPVDSWFLDGFAPAKNPGMWTEDVFTAMARLSAHNARFATFTAAGFVKRGLQAAGFTVDKLRGYGRKRDMLAGSFAGTGRPAASYSNKRIGIIGGGLAGTACAYFLRQYGQEVTLFETGPALASGASGNNIGLYNPRFSQNWSAEAHFYASGYALAHRLYRQLPDIGFAACGNLHLLIDADKEKRLASMAANWGWHADHVQLLDADAASDIAGIRLAHAALYLPDGGMVDPARVCAALAHNTNVVTDTTPELLRDGDGWRLNGTPFDAVVLANGIGANAYLPAERLKLQTVRGQISLVKPGPASARLRCNLQYGGYLSAPFNGVQALGATFQPWLDTTALREEDHVYVTARLQEVQPQLAEGVEVIGGRASLRTTTPQRRPVIGRLDHGLYASLGHGSHGLVTALTGGWQIASHLTLGADLPAIA